MTKLVLVVVVLLLAIAVFRRRDASPPVDVANPPTDEDVDRLIMARRKVEAIKVYRQIHGTDLKDAKDAVDRREKEITG